MNGRLDGKAALIMGATGGIGMACAQMFAKEGARVVVSGRRTAEGEAVAQGIRESGGDAWFMQGDVTEPASVEDVVNRAAEQMGGLDVMLNNAGGSTASDGPVTTGAFDEFWNKMKVDHFGTYLGCRYAIPLMVKAGGGSVINMVSMAGFGGNTSSRAAYASAKAAAINLTKTQAREFVTSRVRINGIAPSATGTDRIRAQIEKYPEARASLEKQPLGLIDPEDVAYAAVFLASDESRMVTGLILPVHGGSFGD